MSTLAFACSDGMSGARPGATPTATADPPAAPSTPSLALPLPTLRLERVFPALSFARLTGLYEAPDGSGRLLAVEQVGRVLAFENRQEVARAGVFLDIRDRVSTAGNEEGLLGLAFAPDFATSGVFYVYYAAAGPRRTIVSRFRASDPLRSTADPASEHRLLEVAQPFSNHKGGQIAFGPDGYLYIGLGDGGSAGDPMSNGQNLGALLGKILRIDVSAGEGAYRVPADNPFVGQQSGG